MNSSNIHFLIGNHEDMMFQTINENALIFKNNKFVSNERTNLWFCDDSRGYNGGLSTALDFVSRDKGTQKDIMDFLKESDIVFPNVEVENNLFYLVHACPEINLKSNKYIDNIGKYSLIQTLWERVPQLIKHNISLKYIFPKDKISVIGHSCVYYFNSLNQKKVDYTNLNIYQHLNSKYDYIAIDCGCAIRDDTKAKLGCIRLDDFQTFYT